MKKLILSFLIILSFQCNWAQKQLNNYKYVIVPKRFEFQNKPNSYRINSLTKYLLGKKGFNTLLDDQVLPDDVLKNRCLALNVKMLVKSNMMQTKVNIAFINCKNKVVYTSGEGSSREKEYQKSYNEAIRGAFKSFDNYKYNYTPQPIKKVKLANVVETKVISKDISINTNTKPLIKKEPIKKITHVKNIKTQINKTLILNGLYVYNSENYEIAKFKKYYIFSKHIHKGNTYKTQPLGFIYKTSKKGSYMVKTTNTFIGYLLENGNFVIDDVASDGTIKTKVFIKNGN